MNVVVGKDKLTIDEESVEVSPGEIYTGDGQNKY